jgi:tetratricopeptide (TPR) repeat protein
MKTKEHRTIFAIAFLWFASTVVPAFGDQNSAQLPALFEQLGGSANPAQARTYEQAIWQQWLNGPSPEASQTLSAAREAMSRGDLEHAEALLTDLASTFPNFAEVWNQRALLRFLREDYKNSLADIAAAIKLEPRHFGALAGRGQCYLRLKEPEAALSAFEAALAIHPWLADVTRNVEVLKAYLNNQNRGI